METIKIILLMLKNLLLDFIAERGSEISGKKFFGNLGLEAINYIPVGTISSTKHIWEIRGLGQTEIRRSDICGRAEHIKINKPDSVVRYVNGTKPIRNVIRETLCTLQ